MAQGSLASLGHPPRRILARYLFFPSANPVPSPAGSLRPPPRFSDCRSNLFRLKSLKRSSHSSPRRTFLQDALASQTPLLQDRTLTARPASRYNSSRAVLARARKA
jgi:hypothetical protein